MVIPANTYANMGAHHKRIKAMSQSQFINWITNLWKNAYDEGYENAKKDLAKDDVFMGDQEQSIIMDSDYLYNILISVKGIGEKRAAMIMDEILKSGGTNDI